MACKKRVFGKRDISNVMVDDRVGCMHYDSKRSARRGEGHDECETKTCMPEISVVSDKADGWLVRGIWSVLV